jgi:uncharacterized protein with GYD domain
MPAYLLQASYSPEGWAAQVRNPQNRLAAVAGMIESVGGRAIASYYAFGPHDVVIIAEMPDNVSAAAFSIAVAAAGAIKSLQTTPLMTPEEGAQAIRAAAGSAYRPPAYP